MKATVLFLLIACACCSCGLLGITQFENNTVTDPVQREKIISRLENTPQAKYQDSLIARIRAATVTIPSDLATTTLVVETYSTYADYLRVHHDKLKPHDTVWLKKSWARYEKSKAEHFKKYFKKPRYKVVYADQKTWQAYDPAIYRYVLKQTVRYDYDRETIPVSSNGTGIAYILTVVNYLYDRQTGAVFREIEDWKLLEK